MKKEEHSCVGLVETVAQVGQGSVERKTPAGEPGVPHFDRIKNCVYVQQPVGHLYQLPASIVDAAGEGARKRDTMLEKNVASTSLPKMPAALYPRG
jgi:hypothetical protein